MAQLYHWPVPCTICQNPVEYHCNTCEDVLCSQCRDNHLKSNAGRNHDVVPYSQRIKPHKSFLQCGSHPGHQCGVWCQTCNRAVCDECVISPQHSGHHFLKLDREIEERRKEMQNQFERYSNILSDWKTSLKDAEKITETYNKDVSQIDREIVDRADEICLQVRKVERESRRRLHEIKEASLKVLLDQQQILTYDIQTLKNKIKELEDTLRSNNTSAILQRLEGEVDLAEPSLSQPHSLPTFTAGSLDIQDLKDMFGNLSEGEQVGKSEPEQSKFMTLLAKPSVESVINIEKDLYVPAISCMGSGQAWVQTARGTLQLSDRKSKARRTVSIDFDIHDMAVTPEENILLSDFYRKRIWSMSTENLIALFSTEWTPRGICCLPSGHIVVAFQDAKRVVQYSSTGKIIKEIRSLFQNPWDVAYSQTNQQLYVCDKSYPDSYTAVGKVLALDMNYKLLYTYTGSDATTFTPMAVCTDLLGHVLITDGINERVHILNKDGNLLQYLKTSHKKGTFLQNLTGKLGLSKPATIDVDSDGYAWIGEYYTGKVKVLKYTSKM